MSVPFSSTGRNPDRIGTDGRFPTASARGIPCTTALVSRQKKLFTKNLTSMGTAFKPSWGWRPTLGDGDDPETQHLQRAPPNTAERAAPFHVSSLLRSHECDKQERDGGHYGAQ